MQPAFLLQVWQPFADPPSISDRLHTLGYLNNLKYLQTNQRYRRICLPGYVIITQIIRILIIFDSLKKNHIFCSTKNPQLHLISGEASGSLEMLSGHVNQHQLVSRIKFLAG